MLFVLLPLFPNSDSSKTRVVSLLSFVIDRVKALPVFDLPVKHFLMIYLEGFGSYDRKVSPDKKKKGENVI